MRPEFSVVLVPSTPINEEILSTAGSWQQNVHEFLLTFGHRGEADRHAALRLMPRITPVSCTGKKPLGITT